MRTAFGLLGPLEARDASGSPVPLGGPKPRLLLAVLLLHRGQLLTIDRLVDCLWGEAAPAGATTTLRTYVGQVRRVLASTGARARLESRAGGYVLEADGADVDAERFEELLSRGQDALHDGDADSAEAALADALALWRGEVLADLDGPDFAVAAAARLEEQRLVAWESWVDVELALGRHRAVVTRLQALVDEHPFRERFAAQLMLALYRSGRQAEALAVSAGTRLRLADELGLDPGPELRELETSMLRQSPDLDRQAPAVPRQRRSDAPTPAPAYADLELLERERERATVVRVIQRAAAGAGGGVAIAGEAGTGKSTLVQVACGDGPRVRVLRGSCDPLSTPRPLGPLRDVAAQAGISSLVQEDEVSLARLCEDVCAALRTEPSVLVVEDLHWVDAATVEVLRFVARRIETMPLALLMTYRDHEIGPAHPARRLLGDLAGLRAHTLVELPPLSEQAVRSLLEASRPGTGEREAARVHALTGGNPFFVTEVINDPGRPLPSTVRDAVLARTVDVAPEDFEFLQLVATAPDRLDDRVLPLLGLGLPALRRLEVTGLLTRSGGGLVYRHELSRQAVESTIPAGGRPRLHAVLLDALERVEGSDPAVLTHHAVAAEDHGRAVRHAVAAAEHAARAGAHRDAVAFLEIALRHVTPGADAERAELLQRLGFEQYLTSSLALALETQRAAIPLWVAADDPRGLAIAHERTAVFEYYNAHRRQAETHAERAASIAGDTGALHEQSSAFATRGFLAYLRGEVDLAATCAAEASRLARSADDAYLELRASFIGTLAGLASGSVDARDRVAEHFEAARDHAWDELASTCHSQLAYMDVEHRRLEAAEHVLDEALPFTSQRDLPICAHWQRSLRARVEFARGHWPEALAHASGVLTEAGMPIATLWPIVISALVPLRRGEPSDPGPALDRAWQLALDIDEPARRLAVLSALAEVAWMTGVEDPRVIGAVEEVHRVAGAPGAEWAVGDLASWLARLGLLDRWPAEVPEPFAHASGGRHAAAADWWTANGEPFVAALTLADSPHPAHRERAVRLLDGLGAVGTARRLGADLRGPVAAGGPPRR